MLQVSFFCPLFPKFPFALNGFVEGTNGSKPHFDIWPPLLWHGGVFSNPSTLNAAPPPCPHFCLKERAALSWFPQFWGMLSPCQDKHWAWVRTFAGAPLGNSQLDNERALDFVWNIKTLKRFLLMFPMGIQMSSERRSTFASSKTVTVNNMTSLSFQRMTPLFLIHPFLHQNMEMQLWLVDHLTLQSERWKLNLSFCFSSNEAFDCGRFLSALPCACATGWGNVSHRIHSASKHIA